MTAQSLSHNEPALDRPVTLRFQGDWGQANLHRVCGWLAQEVGDRSSAGSNITIRSGRGGIDSLQAVLSGEIDVALTTPTVVARMAAKGLGSLAVEGGERLRGLGTVPQRDRLVTCVDAALGISSMDELGSRMSELRIATAPDDGINPVGVAAFRQLEALGITPARLHDAGGSLMTWERPFPSLGAFRDGEANVLIQEAIMTPSWQRIADNHEVVYLDANSPVISAFREWEWPTAVVPKGYLPGLQQDLTALEFSDFLLVCTDQLPEDVASLLAWCIVATRDALEVQYHHFPGDRSPITHPFVPEALASSLIPLHPGAAARYATMSFDETAGDVRLWT
ncbi:MULTISPECIES: TAXI family TRAP transporter solute-binding subunit [unclassified Mycolicibacterium]|uniref:TAXI family TRAP transporter solute-binding subunit n=1 Tax=unclassified Mycolicibacterium TaxID=2636767 RepID=UPI002EDB563D